MLTGGPEAVSPARRLRALLAEKRLVRAPGVSDALSARLVERAGFEAVHLTGGGLSRQIGFPDVGLVSLTEAVAQARAVAEATVLPVIADADSGFGNAINVMRTVREFEAAGVAAVHLEDQVTPKRCGHDDGKRLVPAEEMALKIEAACAARRDPDFVIIARTDARSVEGLEGALERAWAYRKAGADVLFVEAPESPAEVEAIAATLDGPLLINMHSGGRTPALGTAELRRMGYAIVIFPSHLQRAALFGMRRALDLLQREDASAADDPDFMVSFAEREEIAGRSRMAALEERYLRLDKARD